MYNHVNDTIYMSASSIDTTCNFIILTSYVNYSSSSSAITKTITRCTCV